MQTRREQLKAKIDALTTELDDLDVSIKALSPE
jgi:cell division protein FtsL